MKESLDYVKRYTTSEQKWLTIAEFKLKTLHKLFSQRTDGLNAGPEDLAAEFDQILSTTDGEDPYSRSVKRAANTIYRVAAKTAKARAQIFIKTVNEETRKNKTVILIALNWNYKILREAMALKKKGYKCYAIIMAPPNETTTKFFNANFDLVMNDCRNWLVFTALIRQLDATIFHVHCNMWFNFLGALVIDHRNKKAICIAEFDDMLSPYMDRHWIENYQGLVDRDTILIDYVMEGYVCRYADKIIQQFHPDVFDDLASTHGDIAEGIMHQPYPLSAHSHLSVSRPVNSPQTIVWAGQVWDFNEDTRYLIPSSGLYSSFEALLKKGFNCRILLDPAKIPKTPVDWFSKYQNLSQFGNFEILAGPTTDKLPEFISQFHFGIIFFTQDMDKFVVRKVKLRNQIQNKLFSYIEAGLPVLVVEEFDYLARFVNKFGIGLSAPSQEIHTLVRRINQADYQMLVKNVVDFRQKYHAERMIEDVTKVYDHAKTRLPHPEDFAYWDLVK